MNMKYLQIITLILMLGYVDCHSQKDSKSWIDLNYAGDTMEYHRLDIYLPEVSKISYPAVMIIYGSAWFGNNLKQRAFQTLGTPLLKGGFAVISVNHRSSRDAIFPAQIQDIKAAVRFIRANANKYQIDTSFIGVTGYSSGGHLSAFAGTSGAVNLMTVNSTSVQIEGNVGDYTSYSSSVDAVVDWFGPTDFQSIMVHDAPDSPESSLIGGPIQDNDDMCILANPITYVDPNDPPFLIFHGDADPLVPHCQSEKFFKALQNMDVPSEFVLVSKAEHGPGLFVEKYFNMMIDFFRKESKISD
jgi:acetyl esterase/lipase